MIMELINIRKVFMLCVPLARRWVTMLFNMRVGQRELDSWRLAALTHRLPVSTWARRVLVAQAHADLSQARADHKEEPQECDPDGTIK